MSDAIKTALKKKAREKPPEPVLVGEMPLGENIRVMPDPLAQKIDPDKEITLHSIICRAGYQRNVHRTEGISWRTLYDELAAFFEAANVTEDGVSEETDDGGDASEPEAGSAGDAAGAAAAGHDPGQVRDERGGGARPKQRGRRRGRAARS